MLFSVDNREASKWDFETWDNMKHGIPQKIKDVVDKQKVWSSDKTKSQDPAT